MKKVLLLTVVASLCLSAACGGTQTPSETARPGYKLWTSGRTAAEPVEERKTESYTPQEGTAEEFTVANYFSDDMIVPKDKEIVVWGTAPESQNGKIVAGGI